jgi:hypothetical protein
MVDGSGLPTHWGRRFSCPQIDETCLVWIDWAGSSLGFCAKEGDIRFYRLRSHIIDVPLRRVKPAKEVREAAGVGAQGVG